MRYDPPQDWAAPRPAALHDGAEERSPGRSRGKRLLVAAAVVAVVGAGIASLGNDPTNNAATTGLGSTALSHSVPSAQAPASAAARTTTSAAAPVTTPPAAPHLTATKAPPRGAAGAYLPVRAVTPGATDPAVTQATVGSTICRSGFTATIRPPVRYTEALKAAELAHGYAVGGRHDLASYEEDHLIPLELGGSPTSARNLWPEPWERSASHPAGFAAPGTGAQTKDRVEDSLRSRVCNGQVTLSVAQHAIAANWRVAFDTYVGARATSVRRSTPTPSSPKPRSPGLPTVHPGAFCSPAGARGVTTAGTAMVCRLDSKGRRDRWGRA